MSTLRPGATLRLAVAGSRVDGLRIGLTAAGSALTAVALLAALTVLVIGPDDGPYTTGLLAEAGLRPGVAAALAGLCGPALVLLAQCSRIGAPARDRRLAAVRLAGASPAEVTRVVASESGLGALAGALVGVAAFAVLRATVDTGVAGRFFTESGREADRGLRLPTDVALPWWVVAAVAVLVPLLVAGATAWALRRVAITPFGVVRRTRTRPPRLVPLVLVGVGLGLCALLPAATGLATGPYFALVLLAVGLAAAGLLAGQGALALALGRELAARTSRPALLLAGRRMVADPFAVTRSTAVLTVVVLLAAGARHLRGIALATTYDDEFFVGAYHLVDLVLLAGGGLAVLGLLVAASEGIVARRRTYAAVVAAGTPRGVVGRAVLAELLLPLVPALLVAVVVGTVAAVGLFGRTTVGYDEVANAPVEVSVGLAWGALALVYGLALAAAAGTTALSLLFLRSATDPAELRAAA